MSQEAWGSGSGRPWDIPPVNTRAVWAKPTGSGAERMDAPTLAFAETEGKK